MKWFLSHALPSSIALRSQESCVIFIYTLNQIVIFFLLNSLLSKGKGKVPFLHFFFWIKLEDNQIKKNIKAETMVWWASIGLNPEKPVSQFSSVQSLSHVQFCDPMDCSMPVFPIHHQLPELAQTHVHQVGDAIQPSHPLSPTSPPAFNLSQHQGLCQWVSSLHQVAKVLELQLQHHSFQ